MSSIDLNCDLGELPEAITDGTQESLMPFLTSANIACGGHAGDAETMRATIEQALRWNLAIGAHPGYPDRANFGRVELHLSAEAVAETVFEQVRTLGKIAASCGARLTHVKPHGALYNQAAKSPALSTAIAEGVARYSRELIVVGLAGSAMLGTVRHWGLRAAGEAFADRRYEADGSLRSRKFDDALIADAAEAARQALQIAERHTATARDGTKIAVNAETICIHGDTPGTLGIARAIAQTLRQAGVVLRPLSSGPSDDARRESTV